MSLGSRKSSNSRYGFEGDENKEEEEGEEEGEDMEGEEEGEDMEGYLKPTFPQIERKSPSFMFPELRSSSIQVESYGTSSPGAPRSQGQISSRPDLIPPDRTSPSSLTSSNSNQPLVISKSVDI
ncbi:uncharacterized protein LOC111704681 [Eurytemora carolleeae]|uniref:uncharacterized protein LOC111704681 n=1 Tax=Eurytemora carolleeae TaxID=1294199 RepID=UPI000C76FA72|nr:uncharacterized protein LOC111704681 [Eurytemora carolleeae]|eukprot:XP_023332762.1 uncharacterized protein LOC111704681 [Eurytemora affinis]